MDDDCKSRATRARAAEIPFEPPLINFLSLIEAQWNITVWLGPIYTVRFSRMR